jgi:hypothetical protein
MAVCPRCNQDRSRDVAPDPKLGEVERCVQCHTYFLANPPEPEPQARK